MEILLDTSKFRFNLSDKACKLYNEINNIDFNDFNFLTNASGKAYDLSRNDKVLIGVIKELKEKAVPYYYNNIKIINIDEDYRIITDENNVEHIETKKDIKWIKTKEKYIVINTSYEPIIIADEVLEDYTYLKIYVDENNLLNNSLNRTDKTFVNMVKKYKNKATKNDSILSIIVLPENEYRINKYFNYENIETPSTIKWN